MSYNVDNEKVLVFPTKLLYTIGYFNGLCYDVNKYMPLISGNSIYKQRKIIEADTTYKQLIPYVIICYKDLIVSYRRGIRVAEKRLVGKYSIGIGGHISIQDSKQNNNNYIVGLLREVNEELNIQTTYRTTLAALLNDDANNVGKVHFGLVYIMWLDEPKIKKRELSINDLKLTNKTYLQSNTKEYENWSRICIDNIDRLLTLNPCF